MPMPSQNPGSLTGPSLTFAWHGTRDGIDAERQLGAPDAESSSAPSWTRPSRVSRRSAILPQCVTALANTPEAGVVSRDGCGALTTSVGSDGRRAGRSALLDDPVERRSEPATDLCACPGLMSPVVDHELNPCRDQTLPFVAAIIPRDSRVARSPCGGWVEDLRVVGAGARLTCWGERRAPVGRRVCQIVPAAVGHAFFREPPWAAPARSALRKTPSGHQVVSLQRQQCGEHRDAQRFR